MLFQLIKGFIWYIVLCVAAVMLENFRAIYEDVRVTQVSNSK